MLQIFREKLTEKQAEIAYLIYQGKSDKEICAIIGSSIGNIKEHNRKIYKRLGVKNRANLILYAAKNNLPAKYSLDW